MPSSTDNNGDKPITQITRDQMAQTDHDQLVRLSVMLQTIMDGQARLEQQIKDLVTGQATTIAAWEAQSKAVHEAQDIRIRKLEDIGTLWVPKGIAYEKEREETLKRIEALEDRNNQFLGGWKTFVFIGGVLAGLSGLIISIINIFVHTHS